MLTVPVNAPKWGQTQQRVVRVQRPRDAQQLRRIHAVIEGVSEYGPEFEALLMEREKYNEDYAFLFDSNVYLLYVLLTSVTRCPILPLEIIFTTKRGYSVFLANGAFSNVCRRRIVDSTRASH
jgi:Surp module